MSSKIEAHAKVMEAQARVNTARAAVNAAWLRWARNPHASEPTAEYEAAVRASDVVQNALQSALAAERAFQELDNAWGTTQEIEFPGDSHSYTPYTSSSHPVGDAGGYDEKSDARDDPSNYDALYRVTAEEESSYESPDNDLQNYDAPLGGNESLGVDWDIEQEDYGN